MHGPIVCGGGDGSLVLAEMRISWYLELRQGEIAYIEYYAERD